MWRGHVPAGCGRARVPLCHQLRTRLVRVSGTEYHERPSVQRPPGHQATERSGRPVGKYRANESAVECHECGEGTYQPEAGALTCLPKRTCVPGQAVLGNGSKRDDRTCDLCGAGSFSQAQNAVSCLLCPAGKYQPALGSLSCHACPAGRYGSKRGAVSEEAGCVPCEPGTYQLNSGRASCDTCTRDNEQFRACPRGAVTEQICKTNEFVQRGSQKCVPAPHRADNEAVCGNGMLRLRDGFWSSAVPKDTVNASAGVAAGDTAVNRLTVFAKCPAHTAAASTTTPVLSRVPTARAASCAPCARRGRVSTPSRFDEGDTRYHRTIDDLCVQCLAESLADYLKSQTVLFVTMALLVLLIVAMVAMDSRSKWRCGRGLQKRLQGLQRRFYAKGKVMFSFGQIATLFLSVYDVPFPQQFHDFIKFLAFFSIDVFRWIPVDCYVDFDFHHGLCVSTLGMLSLPPLAAACKWLVAWAERTSQHQDDRAARIGALQGRSSASSSSLRSRSTPRVGQDLRGVQLWRSGARG